MADKNISVNSGFSEKKIAVIDEKSLKEKIYIVRGLQVMLDYDLAEIYGYKTYKLNEQVKNNADRFKGEEFMFQLTSEEYRNLMSENRISSWGGRRKLPYAFTEQGIYLLMTVLKGDIAVEQSRKLVRLFKKMKEYIIENQMIFTNKDILAILSQTNENTSAIHRIESSMVKKTDLSDFMKLFESSREAEEILILNGELFKADVAYQSIYGKAKKNIIIIDDYIGVKTLKHLTSAKNNIDITVISDNKAGHPLRKSEYEDYRAEYPERCVSFIRSDNKTHDRYIILDNGTRNMKVFLCGSSSKDSGKKITTILQVRNVCDYKTALKKLLGNGELLLK